MADRRRPMAVRSAPSAAGPSSATDSDRSKPSATAFAYNARVAWALVPAFVNAAGAGTSPVVWALVIGAMVSYLLDALQLRQGSLIGIWGTMIAGYLGLLFSPHVFDPQRPWILNVAVFATAGELFFLSGLWATLQFRWINMYHSGVSMVAERLLFALCPVVSASIQTWGVVNATGASSAPFYLMCLLGVYYYLFAVPLTPSCRPKDKAAMAVTSGGSVQYILGTTESMLQAMMFLCLPTLMYLAIHLPTLWEHSYHWWSMLLLVSLPSLFICFCSKKNTLWWLGLQQEALKSVVWATTITSLVAAVAGIEGRVIFFAFSRYLQLSQPWNWLLVSVALYGVAVLIAGHFLGVIGVRIGQPVSMTLLVVSALAAALVAGAPIWLLPAPLLSAMGLANFYVAREVRDYLFFVAGATISFAWFLTHHFWFLEVKFGSLTMRDLCRFLLVEYGVAIAVPGLLSVDAPVTLTTAVMATQGALLGVLEEQLYGANHDEDEGLYPAYLIVATTLVGELLVHKLHQRKCLHSVGAWILRCLYGAKLAILFIPGTHVLPSAFVVALAISASFVIPTKEEEGPGGVKMNASTGLALVGCIFASMVFGRNMIFDLIVLATDHRPSESLLLGVIILVTGLGALALADRHFPNMPDPKRGVLMLMCMGLLLLILRPPLPAALDTIWDPDHAPQQERDDSTIYGAHPTARAAWPAWTLLVTCLLGVLATSSAAPVQSPFMQLLFAGLSGSGAGVYMSAEFFSSQSVLQLLVVGVCVSTAVLLVFLHRPSPSSPSWMPFVFALVVALLPVAILVQHAQMSPAKGRLPAHEAALAEEVHNMLLAFFTCVFALIGFAIKLKVTTLLREGGGSGNARRGHKVANHTPHTSAARPLHLRPLSASLWAKQMASFGSAWMPAVGNVAVVLCLVLALVMNLQITGGSDEAIFAICPLLLLLNQDVYLFKRIGDKQRYFPLTAAIAVYLLISSASFIVDQVLGPSLDPKQLVMVLKNVVAVIFTVPVHYLFNKFLWEGTRASDLTLLCFAPLNLPPLLLADISSIRWLAGVALVEALTQYIMSRQVRLTGLKYI